MSEIFKSRISNWVRLLTVNITVKSAVQHCVYPIRPSSHCPVLVQKRREKGERESVTLKPFILTHTKMHKNWGFQKRSPKWILTNAEAFENSMEKCKCTKRDENKFVATATTKGVLVARQIQPWFWRKRRPVREKASGFAGFAIWIISNNLLLGWNWC